MSSFRLTAEQSRATRPDAHIWVDASAGTGKTHVLTARVLRLMVDGARPDSILCLTYTKAAAGEMVNRILTRLGQWATLDRQTLREELSVLLGGRSLVSPAHEKRARQLFLTVLDLPSGLNVQTLHAFSQSLLGRFPLESATAPSFETIDDRTAREYASDARDTVLEAALTAQGLPLATAAQTLAQLMSDSSFDAAVNELLGMRTQLEALPKRFEDLSALVHQVLDVPATSDAEVLIADACGDTAFDQSGLQAVRSAIESAGSASEKRTKLPALEQWLRSHTQARAALFDTYARVFLTEKGSPRSAKGLATKAVLKVYPEALDVMTQEAERLVAVREAIALAKLAKETSYVLAFGQALVTRYAARKERAGKLDFSDLIDRTRQLLQSSVPASWVMFRLDAQIDHILIDEAQDNSSVQWDIVSRLADEFFSGLGQQDQPRSLFAVGDMKQSIYGFQGAQPRLFHDSRTAFKGQSRQAHQVFEDVQLAKSFRSVGAVLDVVDETFRGEAGDGLDAQRVTIRHQTHRAGTAGMVDLWPLSLRAEKEEDESDEGWRLPLQERWEKKPDRLLAEAIATDIQARIDAKECLPGRTQPLSGGDFLILVRQRGDLMSHLARALKQKGVPIAGLDRFDLKSPLAVRDLVNLGRFASLPTDDFALACVLKSPLCNVSEKALLSLCSGRAGTLWDAVKTSDLVDGAAKALLRSVLAKADYMPPFELFS
ncbi:MAG: UvrD-helicase domain-containing protein, partial [Pseudomonadota bacterium]